MTHTYNISGMTCNGCQTKVQNLLSSVTGVKKVVVDLQKGKASIEMDKHIPTTDLKTALKDHPRYHLSEDNDIKNHELNGDTSKRTWIQTYKPILLILGYILSVTLLIEAGDFQLMRWTNNFMAGFFLIFSYFKLLNLKGFADNYSTYDIIAKKWHGWGYIYAIIELVLGLAFIANFNPFITNTVTFILMTVSIIGVLQSLLNKRKIQCACLGVVFDLPMSTVTIIEDATMIAMSAFMLVNIIF